MQNLTGSSNVDDEIHIVVIDELGTFSGQKGTVLEVFQTFPKHQMQNLQMVFQFIIEMLYNNKSAVCLVWRTPRNR
jgi:hypothetical protein